MKIIITLIIALFLILAVLHNLKAAEKRSYLAYKFYNISQIHAKLIMVNDYVLLEYIPMTESLFYCPGVVMERVDTATVLVKFVRLPINRKVDGICYAQDKIFLEKIGVDSSQKNTNYILLPSEVKQAIISDNNNSKTLSCI